MSNPVKLLTVSWAAFFSFKSLILYSILDSDLRPPIFSLTKASFTLSISASGITIGWLDMVLFFLSGSFVSLLIVKSFWHYYL